MSRMKIKIGGIAYSIWEDINIHAQNGDRLMGEINYAHKIITLDSNLNRDMKRVTLLHELLHGIINHAGGKHNEGQIDMVSNGLYQIFKENEKVIKSLIWGDK